MTGLALLYSTFIEEEYLVPVKRWRSISPLRDIKGRLSFITEVRRKRYAALIHVGDGSLGAWIAWAARVPLSVRHDARHKSRLKQWLEGRIYTHHVPVLPVAHGILQNPELARPLGLTPSPPFFNGRRQQVTGPTRPPTFVICPDSSQSGRTIPLREVLLIVEGLKVACGDAVIALVGTAGGVADQAARASGVPRSYIGGPLAGVLGLISEADCVIAADSGPGHIAAACGTPLVSIFGPSNPASGTPWAHAGSFFLIRNERPCQPCGADGCENSGAADCLNDLPISQIVKAAYRLKATTADVA